MNLSKPDCLILLCSVSPEHFLLEFFLFILLTLHVVEALLVVLVSDGHSLFLAILLLKVLGLLLLGSPSPIFQLKL